MKPARVIDLQRREYGEVWKLQQELVAQRQRDEIADTLVLVEHPEAITLGRRQSSQGNVVAPGDIPIFEIERGGDVTYHGPGQLVGYPILKLDGDERDLHVYLRNLEEALIGVCADVGLEARRNPGWTGVWIGERKLASLGIAVRRWVTMHGFALNVATDLSRFAAINPCGLDAAVMTSLARELRRDVTLDEIKPLAIARFSSLFGRAFAR
ncbi:MAG: lipoyl(octanoyl) transferase LipB [Myxococcales bacterium]|nr:lipoyl(octanoyl) transferase LipB [Myxococcales bacterium]